LKYNTVCFQLVHPLNTSTIAIMSRYHVIVLAIIGSMMAIDTYFRHSRLRSSGGYKSSGSSRYRSLDGQMTFDDTSGMAARGRLRKSPFFQLSSEEDDISVVGTHSSSTQNTTMQPTPAIAWLLSYPNSGTSFTLELVQKTSNRAVASNYGSADSNFLDPLHLQPPFWEGPMSLPPTYLLTQTHCGGCHDCRQKQHSTAVPTAEAFLNDCSYAYKNTPNGKKIALSYSSNSVARAVHLVRNPFHNIAAKFQRVQRLTSEYRKTAAGFQKWCKDVDQKVDGGSDDLYEKLKSVPCHSELFKYVQWHNLAHEALQSLKVPYTTVHYEMYANETQRDTVSSLLEFLQLDASEEVEVEPFLQKPMSEYDSYFPDHQIDAITYFIRKLASPLTWEDVKDYFPAPSLLQSSIISIAMKPSDVKSKLSDGSGVNWVANINSALENPKNLELMWVQ
jgi:Sulfotransferase domain